jgi:hypothetical protein
VVCCGCPEHPRHRYFRYKKSKFVVVVCERCGAKFKENAYKAHSKSFLAIDGKEVCSYIPEHPSYARFGKKERTKIDRRRNGALQDPRDVFLPPPCECYNLGVFSWRL